GRWRSIGARSCWGASAKPGSPHRKRARGCAGSGPRASATTPIACCPKRWTNRSTSAASPPNWFAYRLFPHFAGETPSRRSKVESSESSGGVRDQLQKAIDELRSAGEKATGDVRSSIDDAVSRLREVSGDPVGKASDQVSSWRDTLDKATEDV